MNVLKYEILGDKLHDIIRFGFALCVATPFMILGFLSAVGPNWTHKKYRKFIRWISDRFLTNK